MKKLTIFLLLLLIILISGCNPENIVNTPTPKIEMTVAPTSTPGPSPSQINDFNYECRKLANLEYDFIVQFSASYKLNKILGNEYDFAAIVANKLYPILTDMAKERTKFYNKYAKDKYFKEEKITRDLLDTFNLCYTFYNFLVTLPSMQEAQSAFEKINDKRNTIKKYVTLLEPAPMPTKAPAPPGIVTKTAFSIGDEATLDCGSSNLVFGATDKTSFDELIKACVAKDEAGVKELIREGKVFTAVNNPKVKILEMDFASKKVRILEGSLEGKALWVTTESVIR